LEAKKSGKKSIGEKKEKKKKEKKECAFKIFFLYLHRRNMKIDELLAQHILFFQKVENKLGHKTHYLLTHI